MTGILNRARRSLVFGAGAIAGWFSTSAAAASGYRIVVQDAAGNTVNTIDNLDVGQIAAIQTHFLQSGRGAVARTIQGKLHDTVSVKDFAAAGDGVTDDTAAIQAAINACASRVQHGGRKLCLPSGRYRITSPLTIPHQFIHIAGDGMWQSQILFDGVDGAAITTAAMQYLRPVLRDFAVIGGPASGKGINFSNVSGQVYLGELKNLYIESGSHALDSSSATGSNFFSMVVDNVAAFSHGGHCFRVACGPAVAWRNCYALTAGPGKAGYRLTGNVTMYSCNGLNAGDYWGVFGSDKTARDGFQSDFPHNDLPDINLIDCNVEDFGSLSAAGVGILVHNHFQRFVFNGGKIDRDNQSSPYKAIIWCRKGPNGGNAPVHLAPGALYLGRGVPSTGHLVSEQDACFEDSRGIFTALGVTGSVDLRLGRQRPLLRMASVATDGMTAYDISAVATHHMVCGVLAYEELALSVVNTTVDAPPVNVTGYTKIVASPSKPAIYSRFAFATAGPQADHLRNGELIIEAANGNVTLANDYAAPNGLRLKVGANRTLAPGEIVRLMRSSNYRPGVPGWVEV